ncbi:hypothetical protein LEP1GSC188_4503 [Leptospira weilii serovar Topaz str. LT2116]|uniref:Uncharacterized protein n=1 Tax=Leptospira weilii serovar Topaz str. LT2116 TaxID=1088540 RepID=M3GBG5_9LEPT|nr:hypothetical protein LEP1GSC188_4503 [Leptospira weilii serovar Topaz str. LT2116]
MTIREIYTYSFGGERSSFFSGLVIKGEINGPIATTFYICSIWNLTTRTYENDTKN